jgi:hypothetical protein
MRAVVRVVLRNAHDANPPPEEATRQTCRRTDDSHLGLQAADALAHAAEETKPTR